MSSQIAEWLSAHLATLTLPEECEGYAMGRGASTEVIERLGIREWVPAATPAPSENFIERYGKYGEKLDGMVTIPLRGPTGSLVGIEARSRFEKKVSEFRLPESKYNPVAINTPRVAEALWKGGCAWVVEGVWDLSALEWCIPKKDAVLAILRAGLSHDTEEFLARFCTNTVYMVYDNDETGRNATHGWTDAQTGKYRPGALTLLSKAGVRVVDYRYRGQDPGDVWSKGGIDKLRQTFKGADF